jgi:hypothetical protein
MPIENRPMSRPATKRNTTQAAANVGRTCLFADGELNEGDLVTAVLIELSPAARSDQSPRFERLDYGPGAWERSPWADGGALLDEGQSAHPADRFGAAPVAVWTYRVGPAEPARRKTFVDDRVLTQFFLRLEGDDDPQSVQFRFVLMLILMRHRKLRHVGTTDNAWKVRLSPAMAEATHASPEQVHEVTDPRLGEAEVGDVARQLSQVLNADVDPDSDDNPDGGDDS